MSETHYDVIIIGGRCAGASLTLWLANSGLKILLVDRSTFPSLPNVPSAPFIHAGTMRLMDELGIDESEYTHPGSKIERFMVAVADYFQAEMPTSQMGLDRNYFRGIDRSLFDQTLWSHAALVPGVTARDGFSVTKILKTDSGMTTGISGKASDGALQTYSADLIVGADGRFSFSARQFGAKVIEEKNDYTSAVYHAEWENVDDYSAEYPDAISSYRTGQYFMILVVPIAERKYHIGAVMRAADANFDKKGFEQAYHESLQRIPHLLNRLKNARCVTDVVGMRPVENGYREAFGANWALVGDAVHYKDPVDGQGIYDALLESKLLAQSILDWRRSGTDWAAAGAAYQQKMMDATHATFLQTVANVRQTLYMNAPPFLLKTIVRWLLTDPDFQTEFLRYLSRAIDPADYKPNLTAKIVANGIRTGLRSRFGS